MLKKFGILSLISAGALAVSIASFAQPRDHAQPKNCDQLRFEERDLKAQIAGIESGDDLKALEKRIVIAKNKLEGLKQEYVKECARQRPPGSLECRRLKGEIVRLEGKLNALEQELKADKKNQAERLRALAFRLSKVEAEIKALHCR